MKNDEIAISVKGLGKRYRRVTKARSDGLREAIMEAARSIVKGGEKSTSQTFWALEDATFDVKRGENVGIIGLNGAGKSTLLKLLSRITTPTKGTAQINGRLGALLEVGTGFHQELTGRENTFLYGSILGMTRKEVEDKFDAIVDFAEIGDFIDTPVKRYSSGMYVRLAFSVAAHLDPDILLLDEVLAVGDFAFQRKCMDFARSLEKKGSTILFVSHNMFSIKTMCNRVIYLRKGRVVFDGPTDEGLRMYDQDARLKQVSWFNDPEAAGAITITGLKLFDDQGRECSLFDHGQRMRIRIEYETTREIIQPDFRVAIERADDIHCMTYSSIADQVDVPSVSGKGVIELRTPPLLLVSDLYTINLSVREKGYGRILTAQHGDSFHVRHPLYTVQQFGVFHEHAQWSVPGNEQRPVPVPETATRATR